MKYAFLGAGRMASAIIQGMLRAKVCGPSEIFAACPEPELLENLSDATGVNVLTSNADAAAAADVIVLAVKPQDVQEAIAQAGAAVTGKLIISIVAGLELARLESIAPGARIIRAMPNTAAMVGRAATAFAGNKSATVEDEETARRVFSSVGEVYPVAEKLLNAVTGLSGSGPAYVYLMIEALSDGGVAVGLPRPLALSLAVQTVAGAAEMVSATAEHPAVLREMVTSPGGTTIAGLSALESRSVRSAFLEAVRAATLRAQELSGK
ncbi:MAG: pyrroline-5-carboxylate reductase [Terrimicrobiaceae bacterium]|nr:pyrroline-5-carboxylate reductase [Terrimicrobiaceae bacterium]